MKTLFALLKRYLAIDLAFFMPGIDSAEEPPPDPIATDVARRSTRLSEEQWSFMRDMFTSEILPRQRQLNQQQDRASAIQLSDMEGAAGLASDLRQQYRDVYMPLERRSAQDAAEFDSEANIQRRVGIASAGVNQAFDNARQRSVQELAKFGIRPDSRALATLNTRLSTQQALADAGARTGVALDTMDRGIALRTGVVNTGRGLANTSAGFSGVSNQSGGGAVAGGAQTQGATNSALGTMNNGLTTAINGMGLGAQLSQNTYNQRMALERDNTNSRNQAYGALVGAGMMMLSSEKAKDRKEPADGDNILEKVKGLRVDRWGYKGDSMLHIGPYAEELHAKFGVGDGTQIGAGDPGGIALAAVKQLNDKVDNLGKKMGLNLEGVR